MVISTHYINPPIPNRRFDWCAVEDNAGENCLVGWGMSEHEAITNLLVKVHVKERGEEFKDFLREEEEEENEN